MEHFYKRNHFSLCCPLDNVTKEAKELTEEEIENIRKLPSFKKLVEDSSKDDRKSLLLNSNFTRVRTFNFFNIFLQLGFNFFQKITWFSCFFQKISANMVKDVIDYTRMFHKALKILHIATNDLPKNPLGRNVGISCYWCKIFSI